MNPVPFGTWESTTTSGLAQPLRKTAAVIVLAAGNLVATGTMAGLPLHRQLTGSYLTTSGVAICHAYEPARRQSISPLMQVRRLTGLTWDQLATVFHVTRRSVFLWASGRPMSAENEEFLARLQSFVLWMDRGSVLANRDLLLSHTPDGLIVLDLLTAGQFDEARAQVGAPRTVVRRVLPSLSREARRDREPPRPVDLLGALQDPIRTAPEKVLSTRRIRRPART